jgi:hypothetical protein
LSGSAEKSELTTKLGASGYQQMLEQIAASEGAGSRTLCHVIFYSRVLLTATLEASGFSPEDNPKWVRFLRKEGMLAPIAKALEIFSLGLRECDHALTRPHLARLAPLDAATRDLGQDFQTDRMSLEQLQRLKGNIDGSPQKLLLKISAIQLDALYLHFLRTKVTTELTGILSVMRFRRVQR